MPTSECPDDTLYIRIDETLLDETMPQLDIHAYIVVSQTFDKTDEIGRNCADQANLPNLVGKEQSRTFRRKATFTLLFCCKNILNRTVSIFLIFHYVIGEERK